MRISFTLFSVLLLGAQAPLSAQAPSAEVLSIEFLGNETFPKDSLARVIVNRETRCRSFSFLGLFCPFGAQRELLNERELAGDVHRLLQHPRFSGSPRRHVDRASVGGCRGVVVPDR